MPLFWWESNSYCLLLQEELGKEKLETSVDFSKLPPNYHNEENKQRKVGNATVYSRHEISKVIKQNMD